MGKRFPFIEKKKPFLSIIVTLAQHRKFSQMYIHMCNVGPTLAQRRRFPKMFIHVCNVGPDQLVHFLTKKWKPLTTDQIGLHSQTKE